MQSFRRLAGFGVVIVYLNLSAEAFSEEAVAPATNANPVTEKAAVSQAAKTDQVIPTSNQEREADAKEEKHHSSVAEMGPETLWQTPGDCGTMSVWDTNMAMCMPLTMPGMPMQMLMLHGNIFGTRVTTQGPRGGHAFVSTQMVMVDAGTSVGDNHYLNLDVMLTAEKWTVPFSGTPLLLQYGDLNHLSAPYIDNQHPHHSPIMGLTLSDTIWLGKDKNHIKIYFAPRGEATDGPLPFPHRLTGVINPDAPLGHHTAQDLSHISSTVFGASLKLGQFRYEASVYNGREYSPDVVTLPVRIPNSLSARVIFELNDQWSFYLSHGFIYSGEGRTSASVYSHLALPGGEWKFHNSLIWGLDTFPGATPLNSFNEEFLFRSKAHRIWGRVEVLQRSSGELGIFRLYDPFTGLLIKHGGVGIPFNWAPPPASPFAKVLPPIADWVAAITLGYTYNFSSWKEVDLGIGGSITKDLIADVYRPYYGGSDPWSAKIFVQMGGMKMWEL